MRRIGKMVMVWMTVLLLATDPASACRWRRWSCCTPCYSTCPSTCVVVSDCSCSTAPACSPPACSTPSCSTTVVPQDTASPPMPQATAPPQAVTPPQTTRSAPPQATRPAQPPTPAPAPGPREALPTPAPAPGPAPQPAAKPGDDSSDLEGLFGDVDGDDGSSKAEDNVKDLSDAVETAADVENVDEATMEEAAAEVESILESDKAAEAGKTDDESLDDVDFSSAVPDTAGPNAMPGDEATDDAAPADDDKATDSDAAAEDLMPADGDVEDAASGDDAADAMPADDDAAAPTDDDAAAPADDAADEDAQPEAKDSSKVDRPETIPAPPVAAASAGPTVDAAVDRQHRPVPSSGAVGVGGRWQGAAAERERPFHHRSVRSPECRRPGLCRTTDAGLGRA